MSNLFKTNRFLPLFVTQFLGAFNDNLFKNAMVILVTYKIMANDGAHASQLVNLAFGLFALPTLLFSFLAGQIADKFDRSHVARWVKISEVGLALVGGAGLVTNNLPLLLFSLFGFGTHAAFFGPVKYAILPQLLKEEELVAGNGYVDAGTFLAILGGTILSGELIPLPYGEVFVAAMMTVFALAGYAVSRKIPYAPAPVSAMKLAINPFRETWNMVRYSSKRRDEFLCILGISWFWFIGALFVAQLPAFVKDVLHANERVVTLFLVDFSIGIAIGSILCARIIKGLVRATPVPLAALGMTFFAYELYRTSSGISFPAGEPLQGLGEFIQQPDAWRILLSFMGLSVCGGLFSVPLYALLQVKADREHGARAIASNNLVNAVFMVTSAGMAVAMVKLGYHVPDIFLVAAILSAGVSLYSCKLLPFSVIGAILKVIYRVEVRGLENWAKAGNRVLVIANHTAYLDAPIFASFLPERVSFAVNTFTAQKWWMKPALMLADLHPIDPTNPMAAKILIDKLKSGHKCMIFPEGRLTMTGSLMKIYEGPGMIADKSGAMILPVRIDGAQYSPFSHLKGKARIRWFPKVTLTFMPPRKFEIPEEIRGRRRRELAGAQLYDLMSQMIFDSSRVNSTLIEALLDARRMHGGSHVIVEDPRRSPMNYGMFVSKCFVLARLIRRSTGQEEKTVGILMPNTVPTAITFFAVQALKRTAAMLNFTLGETQILGASKRVGVKTVVTLRQFVDTAKLAPAIGMLQDAGIKVLYLEDLQKNSGLIDNLYGVFTALMPTLSGMFMPKGEPDDPAVILFTSGSEGMPKGVVLSHKNILANRFQLASRIDFGPQDIVFNCLPMFHSFGLTGGTLLPLLSGVKVFFYPSPLHYRIVPELIYDSNATILFGTDTFLAGYARFANPYDFYALRYVFAGAEKLKDETQRVWFKKFGIRIFEGYGATETAPVLCVNTAMHYSGGTVGRFLPGIETKFEDVTGITQGRKLYVKGPNIMLGYMKDDKPLVLQPLPDGWYDTGDIVSVDEDGYVTIIGRTKRFAKIGGEMISLAAVENVIACVWPDANHALVSIPDERKGEALVLLTDKSDAAPDVLLEPLRQHGLTELAVPRRVIKLDQLPLLGTGKTDYVKARELAMTNLEHHKQEDLMREAGP